MTINLANFNEVHVPIYLLEEERLRNNLSLIRSVAERADVEIILAFKAYALWKTFPIFRENGRCLFHIHQGGLDETWRLLQTADPEASERVYPE